MTSARLLFLLLSIPPVWAQTNSALGRALFRELIEINTTHSAGDTTRAANAMAAHFRKGGFPEDDIHVLEAAPRKGNLVVRFRGSGAERPILFLGHLDVVEALRADWPFDPFVFREEGGYFYGRGTQDMKGDDATLIAAFLRLKREGFQPSRDLILALTADEEGGPDNGVVWLLKNHRELLDAAFCINADAGGGTMRNGRRTNLSVQASEKTRLSFELETTGRGGHSSVPTKDTPIYRMARALERLSQFDFPVHLNEITRMGLERLAAQEHGDRAADIRAVLHDPPDAAAAARLSASPGMNARLRTTCIATLIAGGHAANAIPQRATATVNCRILPNENPDEVERTLIGVLAEPEIKVAREADPLTVSPISIPPAGFLRVLEQQVEKHWGTVPISIVMETGATDGKYLRIAGIPTFGVSGLFGDPDDSRAHGRDERIQVQSFFDALDFIYSLIRDFGEGRKKYPRDPPARHN